uniref:TF-B3 domain-containing protein n=1 Tax=Oryza brachyantha TaxID=4533 RepID=J3LQW0_ORYBR
MYITVSSFGASSLHHHQFVELVCKGKMRADFEHSMSVSRMIGRRVQDDARSNPSRQAISSASKASWNIIPNKFLNQFGGKISRTIELESPKGNVYVVKVTKHMNKTVLQCGREAFADAHQIEESDSLLFRHIENSRFEVTFLDSDGCEKVFSCAGKKMASSAREINVDHIDISSSSQDDSTQSSGGERRRDNLRGKTAKLAASSSSGESGEEATESSTSEHELFDDLVDPQTPAVPGYILSRGTSLSAAQEEKIDMLVEDIRPEVPLYVTTIKHSNVNSHHPTLVIAKNYASEHFRRTSQTITLKCQGKNKKWHPRFYIRKDQVGYILQGHWIDFVRNHLEEGDICVFHLRKFTGRKFRATVHLLCETKSHSLGTLRASPKRIDSRDCRMRPRVTGARRASSKHYVLSDRASLTAEQMTKVEEIVHSIQSDVPIYVSIMSKINVGTDGLYIIAICRNYASKYLPREHQMVTLRRGGKSWQVWFRVNKHDLRMLSRGWKKFAGDNGLQVVDACLFELLSVDENSYTMNVHIIRK